MSDTSKTQAVRMGIFSGIIMLFFLLLSLFIALARKNWERGLKIAVDSVLEESGARAGKMIRLDEALSSSAALFELEEKNTALKNNFVLIVRDTTSWGPLPAVFVYREGRASFLGMAYMKNSISRAWAPGIRDRQTDYWQKKASVIFEDAAKKSGEAR